MDWGPESLNSKTENSSAPPNVCCETHAIPATIVCVCVLCGTEVGERGGGVTNNGRCALYAIDSLDTSDSIIVVAGSIKQICMLKQSVNGSAH